jgi:plastocyanin
MHMNRNMGIILGVLALLLVGGVVWFALSNQPATNTNQLSASTTPAATQMPTSPSVSTDSAMPTETKEFTVTGSAFKFDPAEIKVKQGDKVRIVFKNSGGMHDWVVDEFNARTKVLQSGQSETIEFVADKTGTFEYYCGVGNHRQMGMKGNLVVE